MECDGLSPAILPRVNLEGEADLMHALLMNRVEALAGCLEADKMDVLRVGCPTFGRTGRYAVSRLVLSHGSETTLPALLLMFKAACPKRDVISPERCGVMLPDLTMTGEA
jgi:hypothetical protein